MARLPASDASSAVARRRAVPVLLLASLVSLAPLGLDLHAALEAREAPAEGGEHVLAAPSFGTPERRVIVAAPRALEAALADRGLATPAADAAASGCPFGPGLSTEAGGPILLLGSTRWGRLAESPREGILVLPPSEAVERARAGACVPVARVPQ